MRLKIIKRDLWSIGALHQNEGDGFSCFETFLDELGAKYEAQKNRLHVYLEQIAKSHLGPKALPQGISKSLKDTNGLFELITNDLRVFYFYEGNRMIILTGGLIKDSQKTDRRALKRAKKMMNGYLIAKKEGRIITEDGT